MKVLTTRPFEEDYAALPGMIQGMANRRLRLLLQNPRHPSNRIKKMQDPREIWEGRITQSYRFTFQIQGDMYVLRRIGTHDILRRP